MEITWGDFSWLNVILHHFINSSNVSRSCRKENFLEGRGQKEKVCSKSHLSPAMLLVFLWLLLAKLTKAMTSYSYSSTSGRVVCVTNQSAAQLLTNSQSACSMDSLFQVRRITTEWLVSIFQPISEDSCSCYLGNGRT